MATVADVVIIGGGIAGVSAGAHLVEAGLSVVLVEREPQLAHHSTGRSAAQFLENYGSDQVRRVTSASRRYFQDRSDGAEVPLWKPLPMMAVGGEDMVGELRAEVAAARELAPTTEFLDGEAACELCPVLRRDMVAGALFETDAMDLDVAAIHQSFLATMRGGGADVVRGAEAVELSSIAGGWQVTTPSETLHAGIVVNAAGAWGDVVASRSGVRPLGLSPLRRTACIMAVQSGVATARWPMLAFNGHADAMQGYMKPEPGGILVSPADEHPSEPCDARAEEIDVALGLDAVARWTTLETSRVTSTWAGLRTFAPDRGLVAGFDVDADGFFWLVGQGGYGIQTAPGLGESAASLIADGRLPPSVSELGLEAEDLSPSRLR